MTRLETFTDAAFAFAVTMLVIGGGDSIPASFEEMMLAMKQIPAFAASFANIMVFWYAHHVWSRRFGLDDRASALLSFMLVFVVLVYIYPLKALYSGALEFFSNGYLRSYFALTSYEDVRSMFVIFGSSYVAMSVVIVFLNRHALSRIEELDLSAFEIYETISTVQHWYLNIAVPLSSILLAWLLPDQWLVLAGIVYGAFGIVVPWHSARRSRNRPPRAPARTTGKGSFPRGEP